MNNFGKEVVKDIEKIISDFKVEPCLVKYVYDFKLSSDEEVMEGEELKGLHILLIDECVEDELIRKLECRGWRRISKGMAKHYKYEFGVISECTGLVLAEYGYEFTSKEYAAFFEER